MYDRGGAEFDKPLRPSAAGIVEIVSGSMAVAAETAAYAGLVIMESHPIAGAAVVGISVPYFITGLGGLVSAHNLRKQQK